MIGYTFNEGGSANIGVNTEALLKRRPYISDDLFATHAQNHVAGKAAYVAIDMRR